VKCPTSSNLTPQLGFCSAPRHSPRTAGKAPLPTWHADAHFLSYYATQFKTVEIDSTYYERSMPGSRPKKSLPPATFLRAPGCPPATGGECLGLSVKRLPGQPIG
jgi:hypothetical protein